MDLISPPHIGFKKDKKKPIPSKIIPALDLQNIYIQISEWLQWRIQVSGLGLANNEYTNTEK